VSSSLKTRYNRNKIMTGGVERKFSSAEQLQPVGDVSSAVTEKEVAFGGESRKSDDGSASVSNSTAHQDLRIQQQKSATVTVSTSCNVAQNSLTSTVNNDHRDKAGKSVTSSKETASNHPPYFSRTAGGGDTTAVAGAAVFGGGAAVTATAKQEASFLDSLTDEERRTRSRHIPNVPGFRRLHKSEIKHDLKIAKTVGGFSMLFDDDEERLEGSEDEISNKDISEESAVSEELLTNDEQQAAGGPFVDPCTYNDVVQDTSCNKTFAADDATSAHNNNNTSSSSDSSKIKNNKSNIIRLRSPRTVESVSAFDPPRPPESCASIKKTRMVRWEQNPQDVVLRELESYKNTVIRTRLQLHKTESERQRVEDVGESLRVHYFHSLKATREECQVVEKETQQLQLKSALEADLLYSTRTRSKGNNNCSMRDVLSVLRTRGEKVSSLNSSRRVVDLGNGNITGGGPDSNTQCQCIIPGDRVSTAYGVGVVKNVFGFRLLGKTTVIPPSLCVRLSYGDLHIVFPNNDLKLLTNANCATDAKLVSRWKSMIMSSDTAPLWLDAIAMNPYNMCSKDGYEYPSNDAAPFHSSQNKTIRDSTTTSCIDDHASASSSEVDLESSNVASEVAEGNEERRITGKHVETVLPSTSKVDDDQRRSIPFRGGMLPVAGRYGSLLDECPLLTVQTSLDMSLNSGEGILGRPSNSVIPSNIKDWEGRRQQLYIMKGKVLTLQNQLFQERRARMTNERAFGISQERMERVGMLLTEMTADLQSLKKRLHEELTQLGISQDRAREMLSDFFQEQLTEDKQPRKGIKLVAQDVNSLRTSRRKAEEGSNKNFDETNSCDSNLRRGSKRGRVEEGGVGKQAKRGGRLQR